MFNRFSRQFIFSIIASSISISLVYYYTFGRHDFSSWLISNEFGQQVNNFFILLVAITFSMIINFGFWRLSKKSFKLRKVFLISALLAMTLLIPIRAFAYNASFPVSKEVGNFISPSGIIEGQQLEDIKTEVVTKLRKIDIDDGYIESFESVISIDSLGDEDKYDDSGYYSIMSSAGPDITESWSSGKNVKGGFNGPINEKYIGGFSGSSVVLKESNGKFYVNKPSYSLVRPEVNLYLNVEREQSSKYFYDSTTLIYGFGIGGEMELRAISMSLECDNKSFAAVFNKRGGVKLEEGGSDCPNWR